MDDDYAGQRVVDADGREQADQGIEEDLVGDERADQQDREQQIRAAHAPEAERIAVERADQDRQDHRGDQDAHRVPEADLDALAGEPRAGLAPGRDPGLQVGSAGRARMLPSRISSMVLTEVRSMIQSGSRKNAADEQECVDADPAPGQMARAAAGRLGCGHAALRLPGPYCE